MNKVKIIISFLILIVLIAGAFFLFNKKNINIDLPVSRVESQNSFSIATTTEVGGEKAREYKNVKGRFSLVYPEKMEFKEYDEGNNSYTILFEEKGSDRSFQIFFTPYKDSAITTSRLQMDIPNGDYTKPVEVILADGTRALVFFSSGIAGELREVWFIKNGYLYEVSAYKELDGWLGEILTTLKFI